MKRVLLATSIDAYLHQGGGEQELKNLYKELNKLGFLCDFYGSASLDVDKYDVIIYFSLGNGINIFLDSIDVSKCTLILWPNLWFIDPPKCEYLSFLQGQLNRFDAIVMKTNTELMHLNKYFDLSKIEIINISNFVDERLFDYNPSSVFQEVYGLEEYVLWMGMIEPQKNQLEAVRSMKNSKMPLVISGAIRDKFYFKQCVAEAREPGNEVIFLPPMHYMSELHLSALSNCSLYLEIPLDFPGNSSIEAAFLNNNIAVTDCDWSREVFNSEADFLLPNRFQSIDESFYDVKSSQSVLARSLDSYVPELALNHLVEFIRAD